MENKMMNSVKNMALGLAVGAAVTTAGVMYVNDNKAQAKKAMKAMKKTSKQIAKAGETVVREMTD